jgi:hypothetical protein
MNTIAIALIALSLYTQPQTRTLSTVDGAIYTGITMQRVDPDGLYIEYTLPGGGIGVSKVKFHRLSRAQKKQFGYDANKASDYEEQVAQANQDCSQELMRRYQIEQATRRQRDLENQNAYAGRMAAITQLNAAQAARELSPDSPGADFGRGGMGIGYSPQFTAGGASTTQTTYSAGFSPDPFPNRGVTVRSH